MSDKTKFKKLESERLVLRRPKLSDWMVISYLRSDPEVNKFVLRASAKSEAKAFEFIESKIVEIENGNIFYYAITKKNNDHMIGSICLWNFSNDKKSAELGYDLDPAYQGKGIMFEALDKIITFGFEELQLSKIEAYTQVNNKASIKLLERNGFKLIDSKSDQDNPLNIVYEKRSL